MSVFAVKMDKNNRKRALTNKIKHLFARHKGVQPHKRPPKEYYRSYWFSEPYCNGIKLVAKIKGINKKAAAELLVYWGFKHVMGELVQQHLDQLNSPEGQKNQAGRTRFLIELRRICREQGWDINQILK